MRARPDMPLIPPQAEQLEPSELVDAVDGARLAQAFSLRGTQTVGV
jgi:hypothetical protein